MTGPASGRLWIRNPQLLWRITMGGVVALDASGTLHHVTGPAALLFADLDSIAPEGQPPHDHDALVALIDAGLVEAADAA